LTEGPIVCDAGESAVLSTAVRLGAPLVLIDERRARRIATQVYGLAVKGTAGILVEAKRSGLVPTIRPLLAGMVQRGYFLSARLIEYACQEAAE
jgi:predicted nucleic acid-binding protein